VIETRAEASLGLGTRMLSVIIVTKHGISRGIFFYGRMRVKTRRVSKKKDHDDDHVTTATNDDLVILHDPNSLNLVSDESMWIIDSGATLHVTTRKEFFKSYTPGDFGVLKMGNDGVSKVIGVGDVCLQTNMRMQLLLKGMKHAPDVHFNLIFAHVLDDASYDPLWF